MQKRFLVSLALTLACALLLAACGGSEAPANNSSSANASNKTTSTTTTTTTTTNTPATTTSTPAGTETPSTTASTGSGGKIGVPECDDYLTKYEACISGKIPESARATYNSTLASTREQWKKLADNPQTRATLVQACKMATEQSKTTMKSFGCEF